MAAIATVDNDVEKISSELVRIIEQVTEESGFDPDTPLISILKKDPRGWQGAGREVACALAKRYGISDNELSNAYFEDEGDKTYIKKTIRDIAAYIAKRRTK